MDRKRILSYINLSLLGITIILFVLAKTTTSKQLTGIAIIIEVTIQLIYRVKRKKYRFYTIKENGRTVEIEEKEE